MIKWNYTFKKSWYLLKKKNIVADKHKGQIIDWKMVFTLNIYTCSEFMYNRSHMHTSRYANVDSWFYRVDH